MLFGALIARLRPGADSLPPRRSTSTSSGVSRRALREPVPRRITGRLGRLVIRIPWNSALIPSIAITGLAGWLLWHFLFHSAYFRITEWEVAGVGRLDPNEVRAILLVGEESESPNAWRFDLEQARERVVSHPVVRDARIVRTLPNHVGIEIKERREVAVLVTETGSYLVDVEAVVFRRAGTRELLSSELPLLVLRGEITVEAGDQIPVELFRRALVTAWMLEESASPLARHVSEVTLHPEEGIELVLRGGGRLKAGTIPPAEFLPVAEALVQRIGDSRRIEYADLRFPEDLPWKPVEAAR